MITLIVGSTGAGKTTYARELADKQKALVHSIDNWMKEMFGKDMPEDPAPEWFYENQSWYVERIARCEELIKKLSLKRARYGQPSILDLGFSTTQHRKNFISFFQKNGISIEVHFLDIPVELRKKRVELRNRERGETFVMTVDDSLFEYMEGVFEAPTPEEGVSLIKIKNF